MSHVKPAGDAGAMGCSTRMRPAGFQSTPASRRQRNPCRRLKSRRRMGGRRATRRRWHYSKGMNILLLMVVLLLLFGGGGFYLGGPVIGGSGLGLILLICLVLSITGGFRPRKS